MKQPGRMSAYRYALANVFSGIRDELIKSAPDARIVAVKRSKYRGHNIVVLTLTDGRQLGAAIQA